MRITDVIFRSLNASSSFNANKLAKAAFFARGGQFSTIASSLMGPPDVLKSMSDPSSLKIMKDNLEWYSKTRRLTLQSKLDAPIVIVVKHEYPDEMKSLIKEEMALMRAAIEQMNRNKGSTTNG